MTDTAIVLAAGRGTRFGSKKSKLLVKVDGVSIIERLVNTLIDSGIRRIFMVVGYDYKNVVSVLKKYPIAFLYNPFYKKYGQMYSFSLARNFISHDVLLLDADLVISSNDLKKVVYSPFSVILVDKNKPTEDDMGAIIKKGKLVGLAYGKGENVWMSICKLTGGALKAFSRVNYKSEVSQSDVLNFVSEFALISVIYADSFWMNINTKEDYELVKKVLS